MLVGGMPQVVQAYIEDADFRRPDKIKRQILELYREDIEKFGVPPRAPREGYF